MKMSSRKAYRISRLTAVFIGCFLLITSLPIVAFAMKNVEYFNIQGIRLNSKLDDVKNQVGFRGTEKASKDQFGNIVRYDIEKTSDGARLILKISRDKFGIVNGYEIIKSKEEGKLALNFTGQKRLYRIDYMDQYRAYTTNSRKLYDLLIQKYGDATIENIETLQGEPRNIRACWGTTCNRFSPTTPALKAFIEFATGRLKLTLTDNRIFNKDWKLYKDAASSARSRRLQPIKKGTNQDNVGF